MTLQIRSKILFEESFGDALISVVSNNFTLAIISFGNLFYDII